MSKRKGANKLLKKLLPLLLTVSLVPSLAGCSGNPVENTPVDTSSTTPSPPTETSDSGETATELELRFGDGEITGAYTPVGYIEYSQELVDAVKNNPVAPGWNNKLIHISIADQIPRSTRKGGHPLT